MALGPDQFNAIARLPGVDVLRGQLVGLAASPLTGVVRSLNQLIAGLASQLGQVAEQGLVGGDGGAERPSRGARGRGGPSRRGRGDWPKTTRLPKPTLRQLMRPRRRTAMTPRPTPGMRRRTKWLTPLRLRSGSTS